MSAKRLTDIGMIDLRSDTISRPSPAMRQAMAEAEVGDDVYGGDPIVKTLEREVADLLGKDDAIYMPTGTMTNQVALRTHCAMSDSVLFDQMSHVYMLEGGGPAALSGLLPRLLPTATGIFEPDEITKAIGISHPFFPTTVTSPITLLCVENTHNIGGGTVWPIDRIAAVTERARTHGLKTHMDGARLWHATIASGTSESDYAAHFDSISVCFSKGLGAPVGSALVGSKDFIKRARRFKQQLGGGFRQAGIIAAGALHALRNNRARLEEDHAHAKMLATGIAQLPGIEIDPSRVETNIVRFRVTSISGGEFATRLYQKGVHVLPSGADGIRAIPHLDISREAVTAAIAAIRDVALEAA